MASAKLHIPVADWPDVDRGNTVFLWVPKSNEFRIFKAFHTARQCAEAQGKEHGSCWLCDPNEPGSEWCWYTYSGIGSGWRDTLERNVPNEFKALIMLAKD